MPLRKVTIMVPATTANLGSAFDCMGMALDLFNSVTLERTERPSFQIDGEGEQFLPKSAENRVFRAIKSAYAEMDRPIPVLSVVCKNQIPLMRGLGSSAAAVVGGIAAANALEGNHISNQRCLETAVSIEGHPDNVAPALLGGCQIVIKDASNGEAFVTSAVKVAEGLKAVLFVPDFQMSTARARALLAKEVSREDAIFNIGRAAMLANALASGDWCALRDATQDRLHQAARQAMFPAMPAIISAALDAGAHGAFLSGAGSTIIALATEKESLIAEAMEHEATKAQVSGKTMVLNPTSSGTHITESLE